MSALVSPRGLASPSRSARFSNACGGRGRTAQPCRSHPEKPRGHPAGGGAGITHLVVLHLHVIHVQVQADRGPHGRRRHGKHGAGGGGGQGGRCEPQPPPQCREEGAKTPNQPCPTRPTAPRYSQEIGQEARVVGGGRRRGRRGGQRLLQPVPLGVQPPGHHVGVWLRGERWGGSSGPCSTAPPSTPPRPPSWPGLTTPKGSSWCSGSWGR